MSVSHVQLVRGKLPRRLPAPNCWALYYVRLLQQSQLPQAAASLTIVITTKYFVATKHRVLEQDGIQDVLPQW